MTQYGKSLWIRHNQDMCHMPRKLLSDHWLILCEKQYIVFLDIHPVTKPTTGHVKEIQMKRLEYL